jgi:hypothetical protein
MPAFASIAALVGRWGPRGGGSVAHLEVWLALGVVLFLAWIVALGVHEFRSRNRQKDH